MRLRYKIGLFLVLVALGLCLMTYQSYAVWVKDITATEEQNIKVGCFKIDYDDKSNSSISLKNTYTFTITNNCSIDDEYVITLNTFNSAQIAAGDVVVGHNEGGEDIKTHYEAYNMKEKVKFAITDDDEIPTSGTLLSEHIKDGQNINEDHSEFDVANLETSIVLASGTLKGKTDDQEQGDSKTYKLYLWFDENAGNEIMDQKFEAKLVVIHHATVGKEESSLEEEKVLSE